MALEINSNITYPSGDYLLSPKTPAMNHDTGGRYEIPSLARPGKLALKTKLITRKFANEEARLRNEPFEVVVSEGNMGTALGIQRALDLICGGTVAGTDVGGATAPLPWKYGLGTVYSAIGVGTVTSAESATATTWSDGTGGLHPMDSTAYPSRSSQTVSWKSTFGGTEANFAWNEFTIFQSTTLTDTTARMLIRKVSVQGTKISGQSWECTLAITMS